jgi:hypothetical protein
MSPLKGQAFEKKFKKRKKKRRKELCGTKRPWQIQH